MSIRKTVGGFVELLRGRPRQPVGEGGHMALGDHVRELRARLVRSVLVWFVLFIVALFFYDELLTVVEYPFDAAMDRLGEDQNSTLVLSGVTAGLTLQLKLCGVVALIAASPYWLSQIWGFVVPGLHKQEKKWTRVFAAIAGPLFFLGVAVGWWVLPKGVEVLVGFTPAQAENLVDFGGFFNFTLRMLLIFGIAFQIPLFVVMLNLAGLVTGKKLGQYRAWIVIGTMVFAAVATPSTDPFSMLMLAVPMLLLFAIAEIIARTIDRIRGRTKVTTDAWNDDEASPL